MLFIDKDKAKRSGEKLKGNEPLITCIMYYKGPHFSLSPITQCLDIHTIACMTQEKKKKKLKQRRKRNRKLQYHLVPMKNESQHNFGRLKDEIYVDRQIVENP